MINVPVSIEAEVRKSACPYALLARLRSSHDLPSPAISHGHIRVLAESLSSFVHETGDALADTFLIPVYDCAATTLNEWAMLLGLLLKELRVIDRGAGAKLDVGGIDWDFEFLTERFFVMLFAPLYPSNHPRSSGLPDVGYLLFHPERAFRRFGISGRNPDRLELSRHIQDRFEKAGCGYDLSLVTEVPKALRYIKPIKAGDAPVVWYPPVSLSSFESGVQ